MPKDSLNVPLIQGYQKTKNITAQHVYKIYKEDLRYSPA